MLAKLLKDEDNIQPGKLSTHGSRQCQIVVLDTINPVVALQCYFIFTEELAKLEVPLIPVPLE